ncbi:MAG: hypothetical protein MI757_11410 [Pirellulales bacterium]|nr:hypothetical protein [Pirellulales bacterium]
MIRRRARTALVSCAAIAYAALALGLPLPLAVSRDVSKPYPCMHCACSCASALQCWKSCCCFSDEEKLAWAEREGVTPPAFVRERVERAKADVAKTIADCAANSSCCEPRTVVVKPASCCSSGDDCEPNPHATESTPDRRTTSIIILAHEFKCQGKSLITSLLPAIPLAVDHGKWQPPVTPHTHALIEHACTMSYPPPIPPPQQC